MDNPIAIRDADIMPALKTLSPDFRFLYGGTDEAFRSWSGSAALAIIENKDLRAALTTDQGKRTLVRALQRAATIGLSLNPQEGKAALIAFKDVITYMPMKNGLVELTMRSGKVDLIEVETVYEADGFSVKKTAHGDEFEFSPARKARGGVDGYFAAIVLTDGRSFVKYMDIDQVQAHMKKYAKGLDREGSAWRTSFDGMAQKTVLKALLRSCSIAPDIEKAVEYDDESETEPRDVTPTAEKGTSADDLADTLTRPAETVTVGAEPEGTAAMGPNASEGKPAKAKSADAGLDMF